MRHLFLFLRHFCSAEHSSSLPNTFSSLQIIYVVYFSEHCAMYFRKEQKPTRQRRKMHGITEKGWAEKKNAQNRRQMQRRKVLSRRGKTARQSSNVHIKGVLYLWVTVVPIYRPISPLHAKRSDSLKISLNNLRYNLQLIGHRTKDIWQHSRVDKALPQWHPVIFEIIACKNYRPCPIDAATF